MSQDQKLKCPKCGTEMNHHAMKIDYESNDEELSDNIFGGVLKAAHCCPTCGHIELIPAT